MKNKKIIIIALCLFCASAAFPGLVMKASYADPLFSGMFAIAIVLAALLGGAIASTFYEFPIQPITGKKFLLIFVLFALLLFSAPELIVMIFAEAIYPLFQYELWITISVGIILGIITKIGLLSGLTSGLSVGYLYIGFILNLGRIFFSHHQRGDLESQDVELLATGAIFGGAWRAFWSIVILLIMARFFVSCFKRIQAFKRRRLLQQD